ncbi:hypothetical protein V6N11_060382 [Hibiscus sabdariffa]|uniref:Uncharacterized protein n=1 Tax=Hibiscus sabdariffa TaxID=183260 RepID=A0ABR2QQ64_9ROSI
MQSPSPLDGDLKDSTTDEALVIDLGQARGRPPDGVLQILVSPALERLGSPPAVEDLRIVKKSRGEDGGVEALDYSDAIDFDADGQQGFDGVGLPASSHSKMNGVASMEAKAKATYATRVVGNTYSSLQQWVSSLIPIVLNVAYLASNPPRKLEATKDLRKQATGVPNVLGQSVNVVEHVSARKNLSHHLVTLLEHGHRKNAVEDGSNIKSRGFKVKPNKENSRQGLQEIDSSSSSKVIVNHVGSLKVIGNDPNQSFPEAMVHDSGVLRADEKATSGQ